MIGVDSQNGKAAHEKLTTRRGGDTGTSNDDDVFLVAKSVK
jgi:hypothetical protein